MTFWGTLGDRKTMADTLTISIKFKLTRWQEHGETLISLCQMYSKCLKDGMKALIAQNEINLAIGQTFPCKKCEGRGFDVNNLECDKCNAQGVIEVKKPSGLTISRQAMTKEFPSNMKDSACNEVASTWKSYSALWDKQANRSFPEFKEDGFRFRLRERALVIDHKTKTLTMSLPVGRKFEFGYLGSKDMYEALKNCKTGAFDIMKSKKGDWFIRIFCKVDISKKRNSVHGPIITVHTGMNFCVCALAAYPHGTYRFLFVPYFPLWGAKKRQKNLRKSLQAKGKTKKVKGMEKEYRIGNWYYHTVTKKLSQWISEQRPKEVILGEHIGLRSKAKKGKWEAQKKQNYWLSNYAYRSILDKLKYKLLMAGIDYKTADTFTLKTTRTCSKCGGETFGLEKRGGRLCEDCGKTTSNEWNALKNLLPKSYRRLRRKAVPAERLIKTWAKCSIIESDLKRTLNSLYQKARKVA